MRPIFWRIYLSDRRRFSFNIGPMSVSSIRVRSRFRSFRSRSFSTRSRIPLWSYHYSILRLGIKMVLIRSTTEFFVLNFENICLFFQNFGEIWLNSSQEVSPIHISPKFFKKKWRKILARSKFVIRNLRYFKA